MRKIQNLPDSDFARALRYLKNDHEARFAWHILRRDPRRVIRNLKKSLARNFACVPVSADLQLKIEDFLQREYSELWRSADKIKVRTSPPKLVKIDTRYFARELMEYSRKNKQLDEAFLQEICKDPEKIISILRKYRAGKTWYWVYISESQIDQIENFLREKYPVEFMTAALS